MKSYSVWLLVGLLLAGTPLFAANFDILFTAAGTSASDSRAQDGTAEFVWNGTTLTVKLINTEGTTTGISSLLDGLTFTLAGATFSGITSVSDPNGLCNFSGGVCTTPSAAQVTAGDTTSPFNWGANAGSGPGGASVTTPNIFAGSGSGKPDAIIANNITNTDGFQNDTSHTPYLFGPVTFTLSFTGGPPTGVSNVALWFGTAGENQSATGCTVGGPNCRTPTVPEPTSLALLGGVLFVAGRRLVRLRKSA
jgi:hypothetical protein